MSLAALALVAGPVLALGGVLLGHLVTRQSARELDRWRKREETMRLLRWATELALDESPGRSLIGLEVLNTLVNAPMLDDDDRVLVIAVLDPIAERVTLTEQEGRPP